MLKSTGVSQDPSVMLPFSLFCWLLCSIPPPSFIPLLWLFFLFPFLSGFLSKLSGGMACTRYSCYRRQDETWSFIVFLCFCFWVDFYTPSWSGGMSKWSFILFVSAGGWSCHLCFSLLFFLFLNLNFVLSQYKIVLISSGQPFLTSIRHVSAPW